MRKWFWGVVAVLFALFTSMVIAVISLCNYT